MGHRRNRYTSVLTWFMLHYSKDWVPVGLAIPVDIGYHLAPMATVCLLGVPSGECHSS